MRDLHFINRKISLDKNINLDTVEKVNKFFWKEVRTQILSLDNTGIHVKNFLTFSVSRYNLRKTILKAIKKIKFIKENERLSNKEVLLKTQYDLLRKLLKSRNKLAILYNELYYNE